MRRLASYWLLASALLPAALAFAVGDSAEAEAIRCAIACGHAMGTAEGAACCPVGRSSDGPTWSVCPGSAGRDIPIPIKPQPAILVSVFGLMPRPSTHRLEGPAPAPLSRPGNPPDHVPLFLS